MPFDLLYSEKTNLLSNNLIGRKKKDSCNELGLPLNTLEIRNHFLYWITNMGWLRYQIHSEDLFTCQPVVLFRYTSKHDYSFHLLTFVAKWQ